MLICNRDVSLVHDGLMVLMVKHEAKSMNRTRAGFCWDSMRSVGGCAMRERAEHIWTCVYPHLSVQLLMRHTVANVPSTHGLHGAARFGARVYTLS